MRFLSNPSFQKRKADANRFASYFLMTQKRTLATLITEWPGVFPIRDEKSLANGGSAAAAWSALIVPVFGGWSTPASDSKFA